MEILQLVDQLEQALNRGRRMPFSGSRLIDEEECLRLIDQMRISVPSAIKESERMIAERDRILANAHAQGEATIAQAEQEVREMVSQHYLVEQARRQAEMIVARGRNESERMIQDAHEYALSVLQQLTNQLNRALHESENGIRTIEATRRPTIHQPTIHQPDVDEAGYGDSDYANSDVAGYTDGYADPRYSDSGYDDSSYDSGTPNDAPASSRQASSGQQAKKNPKKQTRTGTASNPPAQGEPDPTDEEIFEADVQSSLNSGNDSEADEKAKK